MINEQESLRLKDEELEKKREKLTQKSTRKVETRVQYIFCSRDVEDSIRNL